MGNIDGCGLAWNFRGLIVFVHSLDMYYAAWLLQSFNIRNFHHLHFHQNTLYFQWIYKQKTMKTIEIFSGNMNRNNVA